MLIMLPFILLIVGLSFGITCIDSQLAQMVAIVAIVGITSAGLLLYAIYKSDIEFSDIFGDDLLTGVNDDTQATRINVLKQAANSMYVLVLDVHYDTLRNHPQFNECIRVNNTLYGKCWLVPADMYLDLGFS